MLTRNMALPYDEIAGFCRRWHVTEFALFGSVLRDDFGPESDVDVLIAFAADAHPTLFDLARMEMELREMFGRGVDMVTRGEVQQSPNYLRRREILSTAEMVYVSH